MARRHQMTAKRRAALRKAQLVSAQKRKGRGRKYAKRTAIATGVVAGVGATAVFGVGAIGAHQIKHASSERYRRNYATIKSAPRRAARRRYKRR